MDATRSRSSAPALPLRRTLPAGGLPVCRAWGDVATRDPLPRGAIAGPQSLAPGLLAALALRPARGIKIPSAGRVLSGMPNTFVVAGIADARRRPWRRAGCCPWRRRQRRARGGCQRGGRRRCPRPGGGRRRGRGMGRSQNGADNRFRPSGRQDQNCRCAAYDNLQNLPAVVMMQIVHRNPPAQIIQRPDCR